VNRRSSASDFTPLDLDFDDLGFASRSDGPRSEIRHRTVDATTEATTTEATTVRYLSAARPFLSSAPLVLMEAEGLHKVELDNRSGFVLSLIDGETSVEDILDLSGMGTEETLAVLEDLRLRGIVKL